uniref:Pco095974 n=1 Tax=Arundo donax TaxID=35708 RepID=A0A0A9D020_ARUDO
MMFNHFYSTCLLIQISFDSLGCLDFFKDHWPNLFLHLEHLRVKRGTLQLVVDRL